MIAQESKNQFGESPIIQFHKMETNNSFMVALQAFLLLSKMRKSKMICRSNFTIIWEKATGLWIITYPDLKDCQALLKLLTKSKKSSILLKVLKDILFQNISLILFIVFVMRCKIKFQKIVCASLKESLNLLPVSSSTKNIMAKNLGLKC